MMAAGMLTFECQSAPIFFMVRGSEAQNLGARK